MASTASLDYAMVAPSSQEKDLQMKKIMMIALLVVMTAPAAQAAKVAKTAAAVTPATAAMPASADATFQQAKQKEIAHAGDKIAEWQKKQACAQAAAKQADLDTCFPKRGSKKAAATPAAPVTK
jgi:hypothetical protein